jgi:tetratricopeptide (TPR) repeat protein
MPEALPNTIENYQAAVSSNPNSAEAYCNLGWGYYGQRKYDDSVKAFRQALSLERNLTDGHFGLGLALKEAGAAQDAVAEFEAVVKLAPQDQNVVRGQMVARLAHGHINRINSGDWSLDTDLKRSAT